jgi:hypothetical protein
MELWAPNSIDRLQTVLLGNIPTVETINDITGKPMPYKIQKVVEETHEDLQTIKSTYESLGVTVLTYPVKKIENSLGMRDVFVVVDDKMYITKNLDCLSELYSSVPNKIQAWWQGGYAPNIYIHHDYAILDRIEPYESYVWWKNELSPKRKIITAFNEGHADGIYCNVADKIWLTNGDALNFQKYWPGTPVLQLSTSAGGVINNWTNYSRWRKGKELLKTKGRFLVAKETLNDQDIKFVDDYLSNWVGYCEETLFDLNFSIIDDKNVMAISQNSEIYEKLESLGITVHKVPFRHKFFWDNGLHCMTNDLRREKVTHTK